jgi:serine/threonine-protein kinase
VFVDDDDNDITQGPTDGFDVSDEPDRPWMLPGERYRIVGEVGRGGMGIVMLVVDLGFNRPLAIKVLRAGLDRSEVAERRFIEEARITGQLQHPGIPPVHEVGRLSDGRPFFSMKLIEGRTLDVLLAKRPSPHTNLPGFLKIFEQIAQTIAYAHSQCVIHRDLKPHNIMVGRFGEVQVMDWGLAKRLAHGKPVEPNPELSAPPATDPSGLAAAVRASVEWSDGQTEAGEILGTFAYMSPEQARGERSAASERWDVFGLGAMLCIILTGKSPYVGDASPDLWRKAQRTPRTDPNDAGQGGDHCARGTQTAPARGCPCSGGCGARRVGQRIWSVVHDGASQSPDADAASQ